MRRAPIKLFQRVRDECGEIGEFRLARQPVAMLSGEAAQEAFFRATDEQLDQAAAYPFMTPDLRRAAWSSTRRPSSASRRLRNQSLRDQFMRGHAEVIAAETERAIAAFGESGEVDLLDFFAELTIYTSSACLIGKPFREELTPEFAIRYHELEKGTDALAYVDPYLPLPSFRTRDRARKRLVELITEIVDARKRTGSDAKDLLSLLASLKRADGSARFSLDTITGMFISMMFAGHHTTSGTAAWTLIELLRNPACMKERRRRARLALRRRPRRQLPGAPRDPGARVLAEGGAAPPSAAHHPDAQGGRGFPLRRLHGARGEDDRGLPRRLEPHAGLLPGPGALRPEPLQGGPRGGRARLRVDPVRRGPPPLRRRGVRDDAAQGDLQRAAPPLRLLAGAGAGELPERPLEDGRAARGAVPREVPAARGDRRAGADPPRVVRGRGEGRRSRASASGSTATSARATPSA